MPTDETLLEENARLRRHVAELTRSLEEERQRVADGERTLAEERAAHAKTATQQRRLHEMFMATPALLSVFRGPEHILELANALCRRLVGSRVRLNTSLREIAPELAEQGFIGLLDRVYATGEPWSGKEIWSRLKQPSSGEEEERCFNMHYEPTYDATGAVDGILYTGIDVTEQVLARREVDAKKAEIERLNATLTEQLEELRSREIFLQELIDANPSLIVARDLSGKILVSNKAFDAFLGSAGATLRGKTYEELLPRHQLEMAQAIDREVLSTGQPQHAERIYPGEGGDRIHQALRFVIHDARGVVCALGGVSTDITDQRRAEEARQRAMEELAQHQARIIEAQRAVLREISTPLIPLSSQVVLLPLIGTIDAQRARQAMERLLTGIEQHRATVTIIDVTGVRTLDKPIADDLLRAAQAARLLGAEVIVTGIQPRIAQILVEIGVDLRGIVTRSTLEEGIAHASGRRGREAPRAGG